MNILIVYPRHNKTRWSFTDLLKRGADQSKFPPKESLITSTFLPITWERKHLDLNSEKLKTKDINWADYIFISGKEEQYKSASQTIKKCKLFGKKIVAFGLLFTEYYDDFEQVDHLVLDDFRITLPELISDLENEIPKKVYHSNAFFEIRRYSETYYSVKSIVGSFLQNIQISYA
jgi:hypothetical protein